MFDDKPKNQITLIVPQEFFNKPETLQSDRGGGETHGFKEFVGRFSFGKKVVDTDTLKANFNQCLNQLGGVMSALNDKVVNGWEVESVSIGLTVSAEGSIGVATAGAEASIEVCFTRKKNEP